MLKLTKIGGGGTDFNVLFAIPNITHMIVYTDGFGDAPFTSSIDTLWLIDENGQLPIVSDRDGEQKTTIGKAKFIPIFDEK